MPPCVPITPELYPRNRLAISKHAGWTTQWSKIAHVTGQNSGNSSTVWPKTHYGKRWTLKSRWCNRGTTMANAEKKVNLYIMLTCLHSNILSITCCMEPIYIWWDFVVTADKELIVNDFYLHMQVCLGLRLSVLTLDFFPPWLNGIAADTGSKLIIIHTYYIYIPGSCLCVYRHTVF